jgi:hypothetical protein
LMALAGRLKLSTILLGLLALALSGCAQVGAQVPTSGQVRVLTTAVVATPTLGPTSGPMFYVPLIVQGIPLEPTVTATRRPGDPPPPTEAEPESVLVAHSITSQSPSTDGFTLDVEGEVRNNGPVAVQAVRVLVDGRNRGGSCGRGALVLLGKTEAVLQPGEAWPFSGTIGLTCEAETVHLETVAVQTDREPLRLAIEDAAVGVTEAGDWQLRGMVRNTTAYVVAYPRVVLTLRNAQGRYLASSVAYTALEELQPGEATPFSVSVAKARMTGWAGFETVATGERR